jgi:hypothetical protein
MRRGPRIGTIAWTLRGDGRPGGTGMATYRMVYGDTEQVVRETFDDVEVEREDGWTVLFRGKEAILRVQDEHVQSLERVGPTGDEAGGR